MVVKSTTLEVGHEQRVAEFKTDLAHKDLRQVIQKYITTGEPVVIESDVYYDLRQKIASKFDIHPRLCLRTLLAA